MARYYGNHVESGTRRRHDRCTSRRGQDFRRNGAASLYSAFESVLESRFESADGKPACHHIQICDESVWKLATTCMGRGLSDYGWCLGIEHSRALALLEKKWIK